MIKQTLMKYTISVCKHVLPRTRGLQGGAINGPAGRYRGVRKDAACFTVNCFARKMELRILAEIADVLHVMTLSGR